MWWLLLLAWAADPVAACDEGDVDACLVVVDRAAERVVAASQPNAPFDPRYMPALKAAVERACQVGDAPSCRWAWGTEEPEPLCKRYDIDAFCASSEAPAAPPTLPSTAHEGQLVPLGDGWVGVGLQELGREGRWFPYADRISATGDAVVVTTGDQVVRFDADGAKTTDLARPGERACETHVGGDAVVARVGPDCDQLRYIDLATGATRTLPIPEDAGRRTRVAGPYVALELRPPLTLLWGPDGTERIDGKLRDLRADGTLLLQRDQHVWMRSTDGTETALDAPVRGTRLIDGGWVEAHGGSIRVVADDGTERGWADSHGIVPIAAIAHPDGRSWAVGGLGATVVIGEGVVQDRAPSWADPASATVRSATPRDARTVQVVGPRGEPLSDVWVDGVRADEQGLIALPDRFQTVFVDGTPRRATLVDERLEVAPLSVVRLPEGLSPVHVARPWTGWIRERTAPDTYLWDFREPAETQELLATVPLPDGRSMPPDASAVWLKPQGARTFEPLQPAVVTVTDASGAPLAAQWIDVDGPHGHRRISDAAGRITVWSAEDLRLSNDALAAELQGDRLVVQGDVPDPVPWPPAAEDLAGAWHAGTEEDRHVLWLVPHRLHPVRPGLAVNGGVGLLTAHGVVFDPISSRRYERPRRDRRRNNARWFTGRWAWSPGDRATYTVKGEDPLAGPVARGGVWDLAGSSDDLVWTAQRDDGTRSLPMRVVQGVFAGLVDPGARFGPVQGPGYFSGHQLEERAEQTWAHMGGWLSGVRLERDVPTTLHLRQGDLRETIRWVYVERLDCGDGHRCARLTYDTMNVHGVKGSGELVIDPQTLHPYRLTHADPRGGWSETVFTWTR